MPSSTPLTCLRCPPGSRPSRLQKRVNEYCEENPAEPECRVYDE